MKFSAESTDLKRAVKAACEVIPPRGINPEATCVYLGLSNGKLLVSGRSESVYVELECPCSPVKSGEALVPARTLLDYISLADGEVILSLDSKNTLTIINGKKKSTIVCLDADRYQTAQFGGKPAFSVSGESLVSCLSRVAFSAAVELVRPAMCGVRMTLLSDGDLRFSAIDNVRVAMCDSVCDVSDGAPADLSATVPSSILRLIQTLFSSPQNVTFSFEPGRGMFSCDSCRLVFASPAGAFPSMAIDRMLELKYAGRTVVGSKEMLDATGLVSVAAEASPTAGSRYLVRLETSSKSRELMLSAMNEVTAANTSVDADHEGDDIAIGFSVRLLRDAVAACAKESDEVEISFTSSVGPVRIAPASKNSTLTTFVMPVRMA